jgi:hypothetical protein
MSIPERQTQTSLDRSEGTAPPQDHAWRIAAVFVAFVLVVGFLLALYVLAWDGGAHT